MHTLEASTIIPVDFCVYPFLCHSMYFNMPCFCTQSPDLSCVQSLMTPPRQKPCHSQQQRICGGHREFMEVKHLQPNCSCCMGSLRLFWCLGLVCQRQPRSRAGKCDQCMVVESTWCAHWPTSHMTTHMTRHLCRKLFGGIIGSRVHFQGGDGSEICKFRHFRNYVHVSAFASAALTTCPDEIAPNGLEGIHLVGQHRVRNEVFIVAWLAWLCVQYTAS